MKSKTGNRPGERILKPEPKPRRDWSKQIVADIRILLWVVTIGGLLLAFYCIRYGYLGSLPWLSAMVGLPWTAHGVVSSFYLSMAKSDHRAGGITFEKAKANGFGASTTTTTTTTTTTAAAAIHAKNDLAVLSPPI